jgi:hypothetical protein
LKECTEIARHVKEVAGKIRGFARRYQIDESRRNDLVDDVERLAISIESSLLGLSDYDLDEAAVRAGTDPVIRRFGELFDERIGHPLDSSNYEAAVKEADRRILNRVPPGYMDKDKKGEGDRRAGDYLVWHQLMIEARKHQRPVLFVCNEEKEDWIANHRGQSLGPRPELVFEFQKEVGTYFYMVNVPGFLLYARKFLGSAVSEKTLAEAKVLRSPVNVSATFSAEARESLGQLTRTESKALDYAINRRMREIGRGKYLSPRAKRLVQKEVPSGRLRVEMLKVTDNLNALMSIISPQDGDGDADIRINVYSVQRREGSAQPMLPDVSEIARAESAVAGVEVPDEDLFGLAQPEDEYLLDEAGND